METKIKDLINDIGYHGPTILGIWTLFLLRNRFPYLVAYIVGFFLNMKISEYLKIWIQEPRPDGCKEDYKRHPIHKFGMPSTHAQTAFYSIFYTFMILHNTNTLIAMCVLGGITLYQRHNMRCHSIKQLTVGVFTGAICAYIAFFCIKSILQNNTMIRLKN